MLQKIKTDVDSLLLVSKLFIWTCYFSQVSHMPLRSIFINVQLTWLSKIDLHVKAKEAYKSWRNLVLLNRVTIICLNHPHSKGCTTTIYLCDETWPRTRSSGGVVGWWTRNVSGERGGMGWDGMGKATCQFGGNRCSTPLWQHVRVRLLAGRGWKQDGLGLELVIRWGVAWGGKRYNGGMR